MARRRSLGWLLALTAVVGLSLVVFIAVPIRSCPTCRSLAKKLVDPVTKTVPFRVNCPECADRGSVTELRRMKGPLVSQAVSHLLQSQREIRQSEFILKLDQVATAAGKIPGEVSGESYYPGPRIGAAVFVRSGEKSLVLVVLQGIRQGRDSAAHSAGLVLLSMDGRVLDTLHCSCHPAWGTMQTEFLEGDPDGAVVAIHAQNETDGAGNLRDANVTAHQLGSGREFPSGLLAQKVVRIGVKEDRFDIFAPARAATQ